MLEKMRDFFEARLDGYDEHMMTNIKSATEFYPFTAKMLPAIANCHILDLGCGTGLELEEYYLLCPSAKVTGIDLSQSMLSVLKKKFSDKNISLIVGSYFDLPLGENIFDAAVSVESLHHFTKEEKRFLYEGLNALMVDKMNVLNQTRSSSWMFPDPEEAREKIYDDMDKVEMLLDKLEEFDDD